jgi:prepilin-type N-terminal cleavage/methylation domain-containing protein
MVKNMNFINLVNPVNPVKKCARQGFTIVELLVAMSLLVMLLGLSGMVFNTTVAAHRAAGATIDVSRNLRAVTEQLNADFRGLRTDAPLAIWFEQQWIDADGDGTQDLDEYVYYDQIQFFADGDFQSTRQYDIGIDGIPDKTVYGNIARIYYGHAWIAETTTPGTIIKNYFDILNTNGSIDRGSLLLARRTHILTSDLNLPPLISPGPYMDAVLYPDFSNFITDGFPPLANDWYEYDQATLMDWKNLCQDVINCDHLLTTSFNNNPDYILGGRPKIDYDDYETLHLLLSQGVIQMQIQWAYTADDLAVPNLFSGVRWWPSTDPDGDRDPVDSDFDSINYSQFGASLEMSGGSSSSEWHDVESINFSKRCRTEVTNNGVFLFKDGFYPKALKFTFVLRDSNGIFADGKTFTHIVYLDN